MAHIRTCAHCGEKFLREKPGQPPKTCSAACKKEYERARKRAYCEANKVDIAEKQKAYREENADVLKAYFRSHYKANKSHILERSKRYHQENREQIITKKREYYEENKQSHLDYMREYRRANPEKVASYLKDWRQKNPERKSALEYERRARKAGAFIEKVDRPGLVKMYGLICHICLGEIPENAVFGHPLYFNIEHVVPLIHGGAHSYENCRPSHASCNQQKNNLLDGWQGIKPRWPDGQVITPADPTSLRP